MLCISKIKPIPYLTTFQRLASPDTKSPSEAQPVPTSFGWAIGNGSTEVSFAKYSCSKSFPFNFPKRNIETSKL